MSNKFLGVGGTDGVAARPLRTDKKGVLETRFASNSIIAKHVDVIIYNGTFGSNRAGLHDATKVIPADYRSHKNKSFYIKNNSDVALIKVSVYGYVDISNPSTYIKIGETTTTRINAGGSLTLTDKTEGLTEINKGVYEGISLMTTFSGVSTGKVDIYMLGSQGGDSVDYQSGGTGEDTIPKLDELKQELISQKNKVSSIEDNLKTYPKKGLELVRKFSNWNDFTVLSIGYDGNAYGSLNRTLFRTNDGMANIEYGQDMSTVEGWEGSISRIYQTYAGYVVVAVVNSTQTGSVWFSKTFKNGFTKLMDFDDGYSGDLGASIYNEGEFRTVILLGEYSTNMVKVGRERKVYASFDGGESFEKIFTSQPVTYSGISGENCHIHATLFDPYENRIWVSHGDGPNAKLFYSDDYGTKWNVVNAFFEGHHQQPTAMMALPERLVMLPDTQLPPAVVSFPKDRSYTLPETEIFGIEHNHSLLPNVGNVGAAAFSIAPYAQDDIRAYFTVPGTADGKRPTVIVGTGDGGRSWHNLFSMRGVLARNGIVGTDKNGYMYLGCAPTGRRGTYIFKQPEWGNLSAKKEPKSKLLFKHVNPSVSNKMFGDSITDYVDATSLNTVIPYDVSDFRRKSVFIENNTTVGISTVEIYGTYGVSAGSPKVLIKRYATPDSVPVGLSKLFSGDGEDLKLLDNAFVGIFVRVGFAAGGTGSYTVSLIGGQ